MIRANKNTEKPASRAETALDRLANQAAKKAGKPKPVQNVRRPPVLALPQEVNLDPEEYADTTPGTVLDMVIAELLTELQSVSEELQFVLYCGNKQGWISEEAREEYAKWRSQKEGTYELDEDNEDESDASDLPATPVTKKRGGSPARSIVVSESGTIKYTTAGEPD